MSLRWLKIWLLLLIIGCNTPNNPSQLVALGSLHFEGLIDREVIVYLPPNYDSNSIEGYPVIYAHDGQNLFNKATSNFNKEWRMDEVLDSLIGQKVISPAIVVGLYSTAERTIEYTPEKPFNLLNDSFKNYYQEVRFLDKNASPKSAAYLSLITKKLKPKIDSLYATNEYAYLFGSSMGGLISLYGLMEYPDIFSGAACISNHWPLTTHKNSNAFRKKYEELIISKHKVFEGKKLYFDYGTETLDSMYQNHQLAIDSLFQSLSVKGLNYKSLKFDGAAHEENSWAKRVHQPLTFLLK